MPASSGLIGTINKRFVPKDSAVSVGLLPLITGKTRSSRSNSPPQIAASVLSSPTVPARKRSTSDEPSQYDRKPNMKRFKQLVVDRRRQPLPSNMRCEKASKRRFPREFVPLACAALVISVFQKRICNILALLPQLMWFVW